MCLTGGFPEVRRLFHLSESAGQVRLWQNGHESQEFMKIEKSLGGDFMRFPEGQEGAGLSGVRQKDPRTLSWVKSG